MRPTGAKALILIAVVTTLSSTQAKDHLALPSHPGAGIFLMLSDIHFDPYAAPRIMEELGAPLRPGCQTSAFGAFAKFGSDTNYVLLKSALDHAAATAAAGRFHFDYVMVTGDFLAHNFDTRYGECVGGGDEAYRKFASDTIRFVDGMIAQALPGVPVFAALGNNDSDQGDYSEPSRFFLQNVGQEWSRMWGEVPTEIRGAALASFGRAGNYALPHPTVRNHELVILNTNWWGDSHASACSEMDPDPGGQLQWLADVLGRVKSAGGTATLIMHIPPGIDAMKSSTGPPRSLWTESCTQKLIAELTNFPVREIYAGHIHRDDFRLVRDPEGRPLCTVHILPSISPVYLNQPAVEVGWYDKGSGELQDYAPLVLNIGDPKPGWSTEYIFSRAYRRARPDFATLEGLIRAIREGDPNSGIGKQYDSYYGAGVGVFVTPDNWRTYSCAQSEITIFRFASCRGSAALPLGKNVSDSGHLSQ